MKKTKKIEGSKIKYFTFPKQSEIAEQWRKACGKDNVNVQNGKICSKHFEDACFVKPLQQQMLNYSPARAKKLRSDAIPTLYLPLTMIASVPEEVLGSSCDINASTTAEAFHTAVPLPVSVADTCYQEVSPQMFSDASLAAETFPSGVVPLPVSGDASLDTDVVHRALPSNM
ncbi:hypothetical protein ALC57_03899 [Trachymyrmex cornetzi]|uniref:THAP-type domain-containing protein n=1 Tax=Trachymyrmex cornetzi TaxID=471704 RepID=A0A151JM51_9HYME|nr:hypothetical protein ALC57_03899 [Trachymyrmex cornetzi]